MRKCKKCGIDFSNRKSDYCSVKCLKSAGNHRNYVERMNGVTRGTIKCNNCGRELKQNRRDRKWCSDDCRIKGHMAKKIKSPIEPKVKPLGVPDHPYAARYCRVCGKKTSKGLHESMIRYLGKSYCSTACGRIANKQEKKGWWEDKNKSTGPVSLLEDVELTEGLKEQLYRSADNELRELHIY